MSTSLAGGVLSSFLNGFRELRVLQPATASAIALIAITFPVARMDYAFSSGTVPPIDSSFSWISWRPGFFLSLASSAAL